MIVVVTLLVKPSCDENFKTYVSDKVEEYNNDSSVLSEEHFCPVNKDVSCKTSDKREIMWLRIYFMST